MGIWKFLHRVREQGMVLSEQCFRKVNPSVLCRMGGGGQGSRELDWKYCNGPGRAIAMSSVLSGK